MILRWKSASCLPVEGETLSPEKLSSLTPVEVARQRLPVGNTSAEVGDLFHVEGELRDRLVLEGDLRTVRRIGRGVATGSILVRGDVGDGLGQGMMGGSIEVEGSAGHSVGSGLRGGRIHIRGSAGRNLGGSDPGARLGMRDGVILVEGDVGDDAGLAMRRGLIAVKGRCGDGLGRGMVAGSVFAFGEVGSNVGRGMKRGSIMLFGDTRPGLGPGFEPSGRDRPTFVSLYLKKLDEWGFAAPGSAFSGRFTRYNGDRCEGGQGEVLSLLGDGGGPRP